MKKSMILTVALSLMAGLAFAAGDADKKGKGKGKADPAKRAEMMIKQCDKDGDQKISKEEFAASKAATRMKEKGGDEAADKFFKNKDKDCDGFLCKDELAAPPKKGKGKAKDGAKKKKKADAS